MVEIIKNEVVFLKKGYMVVRCRGQQEIVDRVSLSEATEREAAFFSDHAHFRFDSSVVSVLESALCRRFSASRTLESRTNL